MNTTMPKLWRRQFHAPKLANLSHIDDCFAEGLRVLPEERTNIQRTQARPGDCVRTTTSTASPARRPSRSSRWAAARLL